LNLQTAQVVISERWLLIAAVFVIAVLLVLSFILWRLNRRQRLFRQLLTMRTTELAKKGVELQFSNERLENQQKTLEKQRDQLDLAFRELTELNQFKQSLMGMIVHDLKNPINTILLLSQMPVSEANRQMIHNAGRQMLHLVLNILDVQKFEETVVVPKREEVDLLPWMREVIGQVALAAAHRGIRIHLDVSPELRGWFDPEMIARVFVNLLTNALKYSPNESDVVVRLRADTQQTLVASVSDQGPGISPEHRDLIFQKFGQAQPRTMGQIRSTGLGLAYCRLAIEAHGGRIWVEDNPGQGSIFVFNLPDAALASYTPSRSVIEQPVDAPLALELDLDDRETLFPVVVRLQRIPFYETGLIIQVLDLLNGSDSPALVSWREQIEQAVFAGNEIRYRHLLKLAGAPSLYTD
jgi:signal transduction histidine kinase